MNLTHTDCGCGSMPIQSPTPCAETVRCRTTLQSISIAQLVYLSGLDEGLCEKFQRLSDVLGLRDCAGNRVSIETPVVLCSDFRAQLCTALSGLAVNGEATTQTLLVGADCKLYTVPAGGEQVETPNAAIDTATVDITLSGTLNRTISASVNVSDDSNNCIEVRADGIYAPCANSQLTTCQEIANFPVGADVQSGTVLIGADCQKHIFIEPSALTVLDTDSVNLTLIGGDVLQADLIVSPNFIGAITPNGLELTCADVLDCAPPVTVSDTQSVDLILTGQHIQANVVISNEDGNNLELKPDGLYISVCEALEYGGPSQVAVPGVTRLVGEDCLKYTLPEQTAPIVADTTTVNLEVGGGTLTANVNVQPNTLLTTGPLGLQVTCESVQDCIGTTTNNFFTYDDIGGSFTFSPSSDAGNAISIGTDGKPFVPPLSVTVSDTSCINMIQVGDDISAVPIISPDAGNVLLCQANGLFVPSSVAEIVGNDTACISVVVAETPGPNQFEVSAVPIISPVLGNALECTVQGLFVSATNLLVSDSSCINLTIDEDPDNTFTLDAALVLDPNPCNAANCTPNGLLVIEHTGGTDSETGAPVQSPAAESGGVVVGADVCIAVANPSDCRSAVLLVTYRFPEVETTGNDETSHITRFFTERSVNIPGVEVTAGFVPLTQVRLSGFSLINVFGIPSSDITHTYILPPSAAGLVCTRASFEVELGTAIVFVGSPAVTFTVFTI